MKITTKLKYTTTDKATSVWRDKNMDTLSRWVYDENNNVKSGIGHQCFHLHLTSHELIFLDDLHYFEPFKDVVKVVKSAFIENESSFYGDKVLATTDESLGLPLIPQELIKLFVEDGIEEFTLKAEADYSRVQEGEPMPMASVDYNPKVNDDNEVIINGYEKKTYTREDMIHALTYGHGEAKKGISHADALVAYRDHL